MRTLLRRWWCAALGLLVLSSASAYAQGAGSTTTLSGVVTDKDGGVVPGATVTVKNDATSVVAATVITNTVGLYTVPSIEPGVYTVTVTLSGFKTFVHSGVRLIAAQPIELKSVLEVGTVSETVNVVANSELVRSNTATVSSTVTAEFITSLPRTDRNALNFLVFLPGVETIGNSARGSTISGLPQNTINITIDGVSNSNNLQSGDGFFSMVVPRLDAIEEVTMTSAVAGADSSGQGAVQVRFVTRSGTNQYQTSVYEFFRHKSLNTNTFFNRLAGLPKPRITVHNYGGRIGGPIVIPGVIDGRGKAFFFFNQEETYQPNETRRTRTVINEAARQGLFTYNTNNPTSVNVLALAAANGQLATQDPTVQALLAQIRSAVSTTGTLTATGTQFNTESYNYLQLVQSTRHSPTMRIDLNVTPKHRVSGSYYWQGFNDTPDTLNGADPNFPGFPAFASQASFRTTGSMALRSTFSSNIVNELRGGWQWSPVDFFGDANPGMFSNQNGYALSFPFGITNAHPGSANGPQWRNTVNWNVDNNMNWLKGSHNFSMGFSFTRLTNVIDNSTTVQAVSLGFNTTSDPAASLFTTANFPNASTGNLSDARALYALLTGRVSSLPGTGRLNTEGTEFIYNGHIIRRERMDEYGLFIQDSWRFKPNITVNYGVRYELQMPFVPTSGTYTMSGLEDLCGPSGLGNGPGGRLCNMFNPGVLLNPGQVPTYVKYDPGNAGYHTDYNNFGPTVGVSWRPNKQDGFWRKILGDPDLSTVSAGFTRTFNRERFDRFTGIFGGNPGATTPATRGTGATNFPLVYPGESWPILFRETNRLGPPDFQEIPQYPITASFASGHDINIFHPDIVVPHTNAWSVGLQRSLDRNTAIEFRYIGNRNVNAWTTENWNDENIYENGFLDEFKLAQQNLRANVQAGRGGTFAYQGPDTGTSPLPIYLAHFSAVPFSQAGDQTRYTSSQFTNSTYVDALDFVFPGPHGTAGNLWTGNSGTWRANAAAAGLASNFWVLNPLVDSANVMMGAAGSRYHSFQTDVRRRLSRGLVINGSYTFAKRWGSSLQELHFDRYYIRSEGIPHAFKFLWNYEIPVGRGKRFGSDMNGWLNAVIGNWEFSGTGRAQLQSYSLENTILVGMSFEEAQREFKKTLIEIDAVTGATTVWDMPQDIRTNTRRAYNTDPTSPTGYPAGEEPTGRYFAPAGGPACMALYQGDCAPDIFFHGPWYAEFDFKFLKRFPFGRKASVDFSAEIYNAFYDQNFSPNLNPGSGANIFRITGQQSGARVGQLVWRVNF